MTTLLITIGIAIVVIVAAIGTLSSSRGNCDETITDIHDENITD